MEDGLIIQRLEALPERQRFALAMYAHARFRHGRSVRHSILGVLLIGAGALLVRAVGLPAGEGIEQDLARVADFFGVLAVIFAGLSPLTMTAIVRRERRAAIDAGAPLDLVDYFGRMPTRWLSNGLD